MTRDDIGIIELCGPQTAAYIEALRQTNDRLTALNKQLVEAVKAAKSSETSDECWADHHGYCQSHGNDPIERCWVKLCEAAIRAAEGEEHA